jgi:uncharacterized protein YbbK (DUF523 family)
LRHETTRPIILVSACLIGCCSRYDAAVPESVDARLGRWLAKGLLLPFCPETAGGLHTPRPSAEIAGGTGRDVLAGDCSVLTRSGEDVTENFIAGARLAVETAGRFDIRAAVLKDGSPSCGTTRIYDGSFTARDIPGQGVAAAHLAAGRVTLFNEDRLAELEKWLSKAIT